MTEFARNGDILGGGTYGTVFTVNMKGRSEQGALKEMYYEHTLSGFGNLREIEILNRLSKNCNFVPQIYYVHIGNYSYKPVNLEEEKRTEFISFICELAHCDGSKYFKKSPSEYDVHTAFKLSSQLLLAISHMHQKDIYHRDIKPGNILVVLNEHRQPQLKLCDYGFATYNSNNSHRSPKINTPWYRAPEVSWRVSNYKMTTDIWCAGCTIYEIFTGEILMKKVGDSDDPVVYFEECLRVIPNEWTPELQRVYRKYGGIGDVKIFGKKELRRIPKSVSSFNPKLSKSGRFNGAQSQWMEKANNLLIDCFDFNYRERKTADQILDGNYFDHLREYINGELHHQSSETFYDQIHINIPEEINQKKIEYFEEAYERLHRRVSDRVFFHAVDLANIFITTFPETTHDHYNIFAASLYYFEKFFSILTLPELPHEFFFKTFTEEELKLEENHQFIDRFIYDFEKIVINKKKLIGLRTYRDVLYEMQDHYSHYLDHDHIKTLLFEFCRIKIWDEGRSYRYMYRYLCNKLFEPEYHVELETHLPIATEVHRK